MAFTPPRTTQIPNESDVEGHTLNDALNEIQNEIESLLPQYQVETRTLSEPPESGILEGMKYIVKAVGAEAWLDQDNNIAIALDDDPGVEDWEFIIPSMGITAYLKDEDAYVYWDGDSWEAAAGIGHNSLIGLQGGDGDLSERFHLTSAQHDDLTDGGETDLHIHDDRYYTETEIGTLLADKADKVEGATEDNFAGLDGDGNMKDSGSKASDFEVAGAVSTHEGTYDHTKLHDQDSDTMLASGTADEVTAEDARDHIDDASIHFPINDAAVETDEVWSSDKVDDELAGKSDTDHTHAHDALTGLGDDDHSQYHNDARGDARYFQETEFVAVSTGVPDAGKPVKLDAAGEIDASMINDGDIDHGSIGGLGDDDHSQYHNNARGDSRYHQKTEFVAVSTGVPDAGKPVKLDAAGEVDASMINDGDIDHGSVGGLADDDHTQYLLASGGRALTGDMSCGSKKLTSLATPVADTDAANKAYVDQLIQGLDWQESVLDRYDPTGGLPTGVTGARYIATATANGWTNKYIYEWDGDSWVETIPNEGYCCTVEDENTAYYYNATSWVVMSSIFNHNDLANIYGGASNDYYHLTSADKTDLTDGGATTLHKHDHGGMDGLADDDHGQYHNDARGDARYHQKTEFVAVSTGVPDAGKPVKLDAAGEIDSSMINDGDIDHGSIGGLGDDDHSQYLNNTRHDTTTRHPLGTVVPHDDHGALSGLSDDDHSQYFNSTRHDQTSAHALGTVVPHDDHGALSGLGDDDHSIYHTDARGDARYPSKSTGVGSPEGAVAGTYLALYEDTGTANLYLKTTNTGNTGWVQITTGGPKMQQQDFWSDVQATVTITNGAGDKALPSVVIPNNTLGTFQRVVAMFKYRKALDSSAALNKLSGAQDIQVKESGAGTYIDAINLQDDQISCPASGETSGDVIIGDIDVKAQVAAINKTYDFQMDEAVADGSNLVLHDVQCGLRVYYL